MFFLFFFIFLWSDFLLEAYTYIDIDTKYMELEQKHWTESYMHFRVYSSPEIPWYDFRLTKKEMIRN
jgi:hypothetical protein